MHVRRWLEIEFGRGCMIMTGRLMQAVIAAMFSLAFSSASAEGNCPPGMYPIGGQGVQGCAPIPGASSGGSATIPTPPPRPLGEWVKTWGALAGSSSGSEGGAFVGEPSERAAKGTAISNCEKNGGRCRIEFTYQNQCVAAVTSELASTGTQYASSGTVESAGEQAMRDCQAAGGAHCRIIYSECSAPVFRKY
jgi:hypothetical protein